MTAQRVRKWQGNIQDRGEWTNIGMTGEIDGVEWAVCLQEENGSGWRNVKISANGMAERKANYRSSWNGERLSASRDMGIMRENRPHIETESVKILSCWQLRGK